MVPDSPAFQQVLERLEQRLQVLGVDLSTSAASLEEVRQAALADDVCSVLMGDDVELRRHFIQTNAKDVRFLDI